MGPMDRKAALAPWAIKNREKGLCGCGRPPKARCKSCEACMAQCRAALRTRQKTAGHCRNCGMVSEVPQCAKCKKWAQENKKRRYDRFRAEGRCGKCGQATEKPGGALCPRHAERSRIGARKAKRKWSIGSSP